MIAVAEFARVCPHRVVRKCASLCLSVLYLTGWLLSLWMAMDKAVLDTEMLFSLFLDLCFGIISRSHSICVDFRRKVAALSSILNIRGRVLLEPTICYSGRVINRSHSRLQRETCFSRANPSAPVCVTTFYYRYLGSVTKELVFKCYLCRGSSLLL